MIGLLGKKVKSLSMDEAKEALEREKDITLIDVRTKEEFRSGHIKDSINLPLDEIAAAENRLKDKDAKLFVYCLSGARSKSACNQLAKLGYTNVTNLGGIVSWRYQIQKGG